MTNIPRALPPAVPQGRRRDLGRQPFFQMCSKIIHILKESVPFGKSSSQTGIFASCSKFKDVVGLQAALLYSVAFSGRVDFPHFLTISDSVPTM